MRPLFETLAFLAFVLALCLLYLVLRHEPRTVSHVAPAEMPVPVVNQNRVLII